MDTALLKMDANLLFAMGLYNIMQNESNTIRAQILNGLSDILSMCYLFHLMLSSWNK